MSVSHADHAVCGSRAELWARRRPARALPDRRLIGSHSGGLESHIFSVRSSLADTNLRPSGEKEAHVNPQTPSPVSIRNSVPEAVSHSLIVLSRLAEAISEQFGQTAAWAR